MKNSCVLFLLVCWFTSCSGEKKEISTNDKTVTESAESQTGVELIENQLGLNKDNIWDNVNEKANWFKSGLKPQTDLKLIPQDFLKFYNSFIKDSLYQKEHIQFKELIAVIGECENTIILNSTNWKYTDWNFIEYFPLENDSARIDGWDNKFYFLQDKFYYEFEQKEVAVIYRVGFEKKNGTWLLTLYYVNAC